jgi:hypothetical protein
MSEQDAKSFWLTVPGIITGVAALVTAIGGLLFTSYQIGWIGKKPDSKVVENKTDKIFVVGEVNDEFGKALTGATIRAINTANNQEIGKEVTDENGRFEIKLEFNRDKDRIKLITEKGGYRKYTLILGTEQITFPAVLIRTTE